MLDFTVNVNAELTEVLEGLASNSAQLTRVLEELAMGRYANEQTKAAVDELVLAINEATSKVALKIDELSAKITTGLTEEEAAELQSDLQTLKERLEALGANPDEPVPPEPEPEPAPEE